ncbi:unannotated protein [freshwater metagenome]|uniref:Unannotated protein n=1 Tax=freshwater metagenome TaxID=449393 RepID=A0A6J6PA57_9ZZZZ
MTHQSRPERLPTTLVCRVVQGYPVDRVSRHSSATRTECYAGTQHTP